VTDFARITASAAGCLSDQTDETIRTAYRTVSRLPIWEEAGY